MLARKSPNRNKEWQPCHTGQWGQRSFRCTCSRTSWEDGRETRRRAPACFLGEAPGASGAERREPFFQSGDVLFGGGQALAGLLDDRVRGLGGEVGVGQLGPGLVGFLAGGGQVFVHAAALGGEVDG